MNSKKKKILFLLIVIALAFLATGCSVPMEVDPETGEKTYKIIHLTTTFAETWQSESWFSALLVWPLAQVLNWLTPKLPAYFGVGLAIALVTIAVQTFITLITWKSTLQTQRMQMLQPELNKIQRKYEGRKDEASQMRQTQEMQALYAKYDVNPLSSIGTLFLQFPVIIAMYQSVYRAEAVAKGSFLGCNLSISPLDGVKGGNFVFAVIFLVMAICQLASMVAPQYLAKMKEKKEAEKHHRKPKDTSNPNQSTMYIMMLPILFFALTWPAAMSVYWAINSLVTLIKTIIVQKLTEKEAN
mgnify:CR=1 FL=1